MGNNFKPKGRFEIFQELQGFVKNLREVSQTLFSKNYCRSLLYPSWQPPFSTAQPPSQPTSALQQMPCVLELHGRPNDVPNPWLQYPLATPYTEPKITHALFRFTSELNQNSHNVLQIHIAEHFIGNP